MGSTWTCEAVRLSAGGAVTVAALCVDSDGPYVGLDDVDPWDVTRDAKRYAGPHPVIAHPPCGPWGMLSARCHTQDPSCAPRAVEQVRAFGGVLEHPLGSRLWAHCMLPRPGELPDAWGGRTYLVEQVAWGHACRKSTLLYVVGVPAEVVVRGIRTGGTPTHWIWGSHVARRTPIPAGLRAASAQIRRRTPPAFRDWLLELALAVRP